MLVLAEFKCDREISIIKDLVENELSEPYTIFTYRYFTNTFPSLTFFCKDDEKYVGVIVCKIDFHKEEHLRGYIGMVAVDEKYRKQGIGTKLVTRAVEMMKMKGAKEVVLETEADNLAAISFYERLGFIKEKVLKMYYLNGSDAYRLKLLLTE
ncbi:putative acyltransfersase [Rozella allomycis CSF55]|uniref:GNAT domain-containing protein n=1 Tax=Rozella allomycis (strain CSF55) TaxID=988480 RepID=A0A075AQM9_ROZAC|nr:GNAT domain-containing protein [Rozella allomycis CSF55]RKP20954.1 putative acyltransfersase [Rozella allomycis CSF55]|eukprot:EPZ32556.1 GNAT domain-containing protein [Rozella allomycis CSF55]